MFVHKHVYLLLYWNCPGWLCRRSNDICTMTKDVRVFTLSPRMGHVPLLTADSLQTMLIHWHMISVRGGSGCRQWVEHLGYICGSVLVSGHTILDGDTQVSFAWILHSWRIRHTFYICSRQTDKGNTSSTKHKHLVSFMMNYWWHGRCC